MFNELSHRFRACLYAGTTGKHHLLSLSQQALTAAAMPETAQHALALQELSRDFLWAAWEHDPLDGDAAGHLLAFHASRPLPANAPLDELRFAAQRLRATEPPREFQTALEFGDTPAMRRIIEQLFVAQGASLRLLRLLFLLRQRDRDPQGALALLQEHGRRLPDRLQGRLAADLAFLLGEFEQAELLYERCSCGVISDMRRGEALLRLGRRDMAVSTWLDCLERSPWNVTLLRRLHDVALGVDGLRSLPNGRMTICLYTWNKADLLRATLDNLRAADIGAARVVILDNASTDATPEVVARFTEQFEEDRIHSERLPVNIGAPGARNWLMTLPVVRDSDWVVFLDDDIMLPPDWLGMLGAASKQHPRAGVWGCKAVDMDAPYIIQTADQYALPPETGDARPFAFAATMLDEFDFGQFDAVAPCATVTGCCHLFQTNALYDVGEFDIRFNPSQFDDVDHDFRLVLSGRVPTCTGLLAARHKQSSGGFKKAAFTAANSHKLFMKYDQCRMQKIAAAVAERQSSDLAERSRALTQCGFDHAFRLPSLLSPSS